MNSHPQDPQPTPQHTPGDWHLDSNGMITVTLPEGNYEIADCNLDGALSDEQITANGRLMAAAPKLLAALQQVRAAMNCHYDGKVIEAEYGAQIVAAIAQAGGALPGLEAITEEEWLERR